MATIKNGMISGSNGNSTFYTLNGVGIIRSKPGKGGVKQSKATKKVASVFGKASAMIHPLLNELATELNFKMIMKNRGKVVSAARVWLTKDLEETNSSFNSFQPTIELNDLVTLEKVFKVPIKLMVSKDNRISVSITSFNPFSDMLAPSKTDDVELKVVLITSVTGKGITEVKKYPVNIIFPYCDAEVGEQIIEFPLQPAVGSNLLVAMTLCYKGYRINGVDRDRKWLPAAVLGLGKSK